MVPCNLACAKIPKIGINTAEIQNPKATSHHRPPDLNPNKGGNIKFPAPKKREKSANAVTSVSFCLPIKINIWKDRTNLYLVTQVD